MLVRMAMNHGNLIKLSFLYVYYDVKCVGSWEALVIVGKIIIMICMVRYRVH